ncbi:Glyoxalase-like domain protein [Gimesia panareensis]|uniref:Glyoxalase-like domain protein n=1 Tax=Gimesia panareensis TaxID=2527978 RepID=A0A517Q828_9PLAN|nr:VOC family protein [Gimesia panareensis]QDT27773.1 Glyoxalase-like domain protein [Gimesia panareensis]
MAPHYIPEGYHAVTPYLLVEGAAKLIEFVALVFDAKTELISYHDDKIGHASLRIGDSMLELADACEEWGATSAALHIYVPDVDSTFQKALEAGATCQREPADQFYGERSASVKDPFGIQWHIATQIEVLTKEELLHRAEEFKQQQFHQQQQQQ